MPKIYTPDIKNTNIDLIRTPMYTYEYNSPANSLKANNLVGVITQAKDVNETKTTGDGILNLKDVHPIGHNKSLNLRRRKENKDTFIRMKF
jgi:hypothetical protein